MTKLSLRKQMVRQSTALAEAEYELSRDEKRIIYLAAILCAQNGETTQQSFTGITDYEIKVSEYSAIFDVKGHEASRDVKNAINSIYNKSVKIADHEASSDSEQSVEEIRWITGMKNLPKRGSWNITLNDRIIPHLTDLANKIKYPIGQVYKLQNNYQFRLYDLLADELSGERTIEVDWLKVKFKLTDKRSYNTYSNLKNRIIEPAITQINATTNMNISYTENTPAENKSRKVISWTFTYTPPPKN